MRTFFKFILQSIKWLFLAVFSVALIAGGYSAYVLHRLNQELPQDLNELNPPSYSLPTVIYDRHGNPVEEISIHRRIAVPFETFPPSLIQALLASKDTRFFAHWGFDPIQMLKTLRKNITLEELLAETRTLTQQTAALFFLTNPQTTAQRLKEILLALRLEQQFSKEELLTMYLNKIFLGNAEGIEAATQEYFGKHTQDLNLAESALLIGLLPDPSLYSPAVNPDLAKQQRNRVLRQMFEKGYISDAERRSASRAPIKLSKIYDSTSSATAYYLEHVKKQLLQNYGSEALYSGGLQVHLAMDLNYQVEAHRALQKGLVEVSKEQGYRGALEHLDLNPQGELPEREIYRVTQRNQVQPGNIVQGVVTKISQKAVLVRLGQEQGRLEGAHLRQWKLRKFGDPPTAVPIQAPSQLLKIGDVVQVWVQQWDSKQELFRLTLHQEPLVNGALLAIDPKTGEVLAMTGGYRYDQSDFNRALQAQRQAGSVFAPVVYAAAIDAGYTLASNLVDSPRHYRAKTSSTAEETPLQNEENPLLGNVSLRTAFVKGLNRPTVALVEDLKPKRIIRYAKKMGISSEMKNDYTIGLGDFSVTLQEMVFAFGAFANGGKRQDPIYITRVEDAEGNIQEEHAPQRHSVLARGTAFLVLDAMQGVVQQGTGKIAQKIGRPSAGKTGTTNNNLDAWYIGFIPQVVTGVHVGFDEPASMGKEVTGATAAAPIWADFMKSATNGLPAQRFARPSQIVSVKIHKSGRRVGPCDAEEETYHERFKRGTEPLLDTSLNQPCAQEPEAPLAQQAELDL